MINIEKLKPILAGYKVYFPSHWDDEKYKWEAIKHFQDHWDIQADDFAEMLKTATDKTFNLLASGYAYPRGMIINFAKANGEETRQMFRELFDESRDLGERVGAFQDAAETMRVKYDDGTWKNHYQSTNAISTYLWMMYPDKYYIYKYELFRDAAVELEANYKAKRDGSVDTMVGGFRMYDEICQAVQQDAELADMLKAALTSSCYPDPQMRTATVDIGFYLSRFFLGERKARQEEEGWLRCLFISRRRTSTPVIWKANYFLQFSVALQKVNQFPLLRMSHGPFRKGSKTAPSKLDIRHTVIRT